MGRSRQTLRQEWRDVRGWVPWLVAGVYFPLYVALDVVAGGPLAGALWLPRSVSVALCSLGVAFLVAAAVIVTKMDALSPGRIVESVDPRTRRPHRGRSTLGSGGGVNRKTVETEVPDPSRVEGQRETESASRDSSPTSGPTDGEEEDWPDEWIPGDEV